MESWQLGKSKYYTQDIPEEVLNKYDPKSLALKDNQSNSYGKDETPFKYGWQRDKNQINGQFDWDIILYPQIVTIAMLDAVNPAGKNKQNLEIVLPLNKYFSIYGISNKKEIAHFLSQTAHESQLKKVEEDLNYKAKQMRKVYGCAGNQNGYDTKTDDCKPGRKRIRPMLWTEEKKYAHNPENLGNLVYNRKSMGNTELGDGFKYRGRGIIQLTGKNNYKQFQTTHDKNNPQDKKDFVKNPDLLISSYQYAIEGAVIYWMNREDLHTTAQTGTVEAVTNIVNNGLNGYSDRLQRFNKVASLLGIAQESK